ncbi:hypothetical protein FMM79_14410 [Novosphingobium sp. BW1]|nr:hypothetical protein FMM79_14410 [Novosphingobium sp. BW1]
MDLNHEYAAHQRALLQASRARNDDDRHMHMLTASTIARGINEFQHNLGAAAACAWSQACVAPSSSTRPQSVSRAT